MHRPCPSASACFKCVSDPDPADAWRLLRGCPAALPPGRELTLSSLCLGEKQSAGTVPAKPVARTECLIEREARARIQNNWAPMGQGWHGVGRSEALTLHS